MTFEAIKRANENGQQEYFFHDKNLLTTNTFLFICTLRGKSDTKNYNSKKQILKIQQKKKKVLVFLAVSLLLQNSVSWAACVKDPLCHLETAGNSYVTPTCIESDQQLGCTADYQVFIFIFFIFVIVVVVVVVRGLTIHI